MKMNYLKGTALAAVAAVGLAAPANAVPVDLELSLLIDVSGSVDSNEYALQKGGYVAAFNNATVQAAILAGTLGKIAVNFIEWSGSSQQSQQIGWTLIDSAQAATNFAAAISGLSRSYSGLTAPGSAINYASPLFANSYEGTRNVIDVSGDGAQNDGSSTSAASAAFCGASTSNAINGIAILGETGLLDFYKNNIQCGTDSFTVAASGFDSFESAIATKLVAEITGNPPGSIPLPVPAVLLMTGLGGFAAFRRRK